MSGKDDESLRMTTPPINHHCVIKLQLHSHSAAVSHVGQEHTLNLLPEVEEDGQRDKQGGYG